MSQSLWLYRLWMTRNVIIACLLFCHLLARTGMGINKGFFFRNDFPMRVWVSRSRTIIVQNISISVLISDCIVVGSLDTHLLEIYPPNFMISLIYGMQISAVLQIPEDQDLRWIQDPVGCHCSKSWFDCARYVLLFFFRGLNDKALDQFKSRTDVTLPGLYKCTSGLGANKKINGQH